MKRLENNNSDNIIQITIGDTSMNTLFQNSQNNSPIKPFE